uniref:Uncharacterized protein n=1 Tax=Arundo donax TaxID=35708 RepID=A0A0A8Z8C8_ARUDO
MLNAEIIGP